MFTFRIIRHKLRSRFRIVRIRPKRLTKRHTRLALATHASTARTLVHARLEHFNKHYQLTYGDVRIRAQATRWGSCSAKGNLNFNYRIALLPAHLADYIIVHELCHRGQFNHSQAFWDLVAETQPEWQKHRAELKKISLYSLK